MGQTVTHPALDIEHWDDTVPPEIIIADGYNITIAVREGHLMITDGTPSDKRIRKIPRVGHPMRTLIVLGKHGYITYEAKEWMQALRIRYVEIRTHRVADAGRCDPRTVRGQATGSLAAVRYLMKEKLNGQATITEWLGEPLAAKKIIRHAALINDSDLAGIRSAEAVSARAYWTVWRKHLVIPWHPSELRTLPGHWTVFPGRATLRRGLKRNEDATDPVNAMLNYSYTLAASACTVACHAYGLEPSLGILHESRSDYDAFAWDLVEALRPACDDRVYSYLRSLQFFDRRWCHETGNGSVVLDPPLTHVIAGWWHDRLVEALRIGKEVKRMLVTGP